MDTLCSQPIDGRSRRGYALKRVVEVACRGSLCPRGFESYLRRVWPTLLSWCRLFRLFCEARESKIYVRNVGKIVLCRHLSYGLKSAKCLKISTKSLVDSKLLRIFARFCARYAPMGVARGRV